MGNLYSGSCELSLRLLLILISTRRISSSDSSVYGDECKYHGNMCDVDPEKCLRQMKENTALTTVCSQIYYGCNLYKTRQHTKFWITIDDYVRRRFPPGENLTYTIYRKNASRTNWAIPGRLTRVPGCCSMTTSDSCILPRKEPGETQYIFMPLYKRSAWYCIFELEEHPGKPDYCEDDDDVDCIEFANGTVRKRSNYIPTSTQSYQSSIDFCFFTPTDDYVDIPNDTDSHPPYPTKAISILGSGDDIMASSAKSNFSCILVKGRQTPNIAHLTAKYHQRLMGDFVCFFFRLPEISELWYDARCEKPVLLPATTLQTSPYAGRNNSQVTIAVVVVLCLVIIVLIIVVVVVWLYKKHLITLTYAKTIEELPNTLAWDKVEGRGFVDAESVSEESLQAPEKEIPDVITFFPNDKDTCRHEEQRGVVTSTHDQAPNGDIRYTELVFLDDSQEMPSSALESPDSDCHSGYRKALIHVDGNERNESVNNTSEHDFEFSATSISNRIDDGMATPSTGSCQPQAITDVDKSLDKNIVEYLKKSSISQ